MADVKLDRLSKIFPGPVHAVRELTLAVADGEFVVLVGPSGCGKSTVLRMVAGLEPLTSGSISIGGRVVDDLSPKDRNIAMVFQNYALYPHMTVARNITFGLRMRKVPRDVVARKLGETAELLGIADLLERKPRALSGGQQQRVALGRAIVREPACFLFDEPLSNLDAKLRVQMRGELKALHQRLRTTTLYVTHDQEEAMTLGDRVVVLCEGQVQQVGRPLDVYRRPANSFVAGFVGSPPINFVRGALRREGGALLFDDGSGLRVPLATGPRAAERAEVVLGIRPEALRPVEAGRDGEQLSLKVTVCEPVGDRMDVHAVTSGGVPLVARVAASESLGPGQTVRFQLDRTAIHLFEPGPFGRRVEVSTG